MLNKNKFLVFAAFISVGILFENSFIKDKKIMFNAKKNFKDHELQNYKRTSGKK